MKPILWCFLAACVVAACTGQVPESVSGSPGEPTTTPPPTATVPGDAGPSWLSLGATGHLVIAQLAQGVSMVDLATGHVSNLYAPSDPTVEWVNAASASPDGSQILVAFAPPPQNDQVQYGYTRLYILPADGSSAPQPFLVPQGDEESYFDPNWSAQGDSLTYAHLVHFAIPNTTPQQYGFKYTIERVSYPVGQVKTLAENGFWPRLSRDGQKLVYVSIDPDTGATQPVVCDALCTDPKPIPVPDEFQTVDSPLFTPDGKSLLLSVVTQGLSDLAPGGDPSWWDRLLGVVPAGAHNIPSDWWLVPLDGSPPTQLTHVSDVGLFGSFSPDGQLLAYGSQSGLFVGQADATGFQQIEDLQAVLTVDWIP
jgi:hypothetical protein